MRVVLLLYLRRVPALIPGILVLQPEELLLLHQRQPHFIQLQVLTALAVPQPELPEGPAGNPGAHPEDRADGQQHADDHPVQLGEVNRCRHHP